MVTSIPFFSFTEMATNRLTPTGGVTCPMARLTVATIPECYQVIAKSFADRKHNRDKDIHGRVCIDKTSCDQENDIDDQQECKLIMCNASEQIGSCLRDTEFGADKGKQGSACYDEHNTAGGLLQSLPSDPTDL